MFEVDLDEAKRLYAEALRHGGLNAFHTFKLLRRIYASPSRGEKDA